MSDEIWHFHIDFLETPASEVVKRHWADDELNRERSLTTFKDELDLVDQGLALYIEPVQAALKNHTALEDDFSLRASIAMLEHAFNSFLAWRHLLALGYLAEGNLFRRSVYESLCQAMVFKSNESFATKFYEGKEIPARDIRKKISLLLADEEKNQDAVLSIFKEAYANLSSGAHPTLASFALRTGARSSDYERLKMVVPENVVIGGLLNDDIGRAVWLAFARDVASALTVVGSVITEGTGGWDKDSQEYRKTVEKLLEEFQAERGQQDEN